MSAEHQPAEPPGGCAPASGRRSTEVTPEIVGDWVTAERGETLDAQGILEGTSREFATASAAGYHLRSTYLNSLARNSA